VFYLIIDKIAPGWAKGAKNMAEKLLNENIVSQIREVFEQLENPVEVMFFGSKRDCEYCDDTLQLAGEVVAISDKLSLKQYDIDDDAELARQYNVDKVPGLVIAARDGDQVTDYGVRLAGIPSGHEFSTLIHDMVLVSSRESGLSQETRRFLQEVTQPVLLQVFVTPT
jgi:alkyl hydroperoxide reductase subunit AhpF